MATMEVGDDGQGGEPAIVVVERRIDPSELARLTRLFFEDMVKLVIDVRRRCAACC